MQASEYHSFGLKAIVKKNEKLKKKGKRIWNKNNEHYIK